MGIEFNNFMSIEGKKIAKASAEVVHSPVELNVHIGLEDGTSCSLCFKLEKEIEKLDTERHR
jgi:hypothetical protein